MGKRVLSIKENKQKSKLPILAVAVVSMFLLIALVAVLVKDKDFKFVKPVVEKEEKPEEVKFVPSAETVERSEDVFNFIEIMKNQNKALNLSPDSGYVYPGVPAELNEYPIYKTCDGRVMPNNVNPFASYSWAMLAYVSMYDITGDEKYIIQIRETEQKLYLIYEKMLPRATITMFHPVYNIYLMLKGKSVLVDESKFKDMIVTDTEFFIDEGEANDINSQSYSFAQDVAMMSVGFTDAAKLLVDENADQVRIEKLFEKAEALNKRAETVSKDGSNQDGVMCWLLWSNYYYDEAKGFDTNKYVSTLLSSEFTKQLKSKELLTANTFQPCMEVIVDLYGTTKNIKLITKYKEFYEYYNTPDSFVKDNGCTADENFALRNKYYDELGGHYYLSDNAYQIYLNHISKDFNGVLK